MVRTMTGCSVVGVIGGTAGSISPQRYGLLNNLDILGIVATNSSQIPKTPSSIDDNVKLITAVQQFDDYGAVITTHREYVDLMSSDNDYKILKVLSNLLENSKIESDARWEKIYKSYIPLIKEIEKEYSEDYSHVVEALNKAAEVLSKGGDITKLPPEVYAVVYPAYYHQIIEETLPGFTITAARIIADEKPTGRFASFFATAVVPTAGLRNHAFLYDIMLYNFDESDYEVSGNNFIPLVTTVHTSYKVINKCGIIETDETYNSICKNPNMSVIAPCVYSTVKIININEENECHEKTEEVKSIEALALVALNEIRACESDPIVEAHLKTDLMTKAVAKIFGYSKC